MHFFRPQQMLKLNSKNLKTKKFGKIGYSFYSWWDEVKTKKKTLLLKKEIQFSLAMRGFTCTGIINLQIPREPFQAQVDEIPGPDLQIPREPFQALV